MEWWSGILLCVFIGSLVWTTITIFAITGASENKTDMIKAITNVVIVNMILVLVLAGVGYFYTQTNPAAKQPYMMFMLHFNIFLSIIGISVSSLYTGKPTIGT
jgi:Na+/serine symporter